MIFYFIVLKEMQAYLSFHIKNQIISLEIIQLL